MRSLLQRFCRCLSVSSSRRRLDVSARDQAVATLESRIVLSDLSGWVGNAQLSGDVVSVNWTVYNQAPDMIFSGFNVDFWLSRDTSFSVDDRFIGAEFLPSGFPGFYSLPTLTKAMGLPASSDSYWSGGGSSYNILMLIDPYNNVWESNEWNNVSTTPFTRGNGGGGGGGGIGQISDLNQLPETGARAGAVLSAVFTNLQARLKEAASAQSAMSSSVAKAVALPNVSKDLTSMNSSIASIAKLFANYIKGTATSVTLAPGVVLDAADLDLMERYLYFVYTDPSTASAANQGTSAPAVGAAANIFDPKSLLPKLSDYPKLQKAADFVNSAIDATKGALAKVDNGIRWVVEQLDGTAKARLQAEREAKAVAEAKELAERAAQLERELATPSIEDMLAAMDNTMHGAPMIFTMASNRLKALMKNIRGSVHKLEDEVVDLEAFQRARLLPGTWQGRVDRQADNLSGDIKLTFKPSLNGTVSGTIDHTFYNGRSKARTTGTFTGVLDEFNVFRGTATVSNSSGSGTYPISWNLNGTTFSGTLYTGEMITFSATKS
jgi:hypothetical protein